MIYLILISILLNVKNLQAQSCSINGTSLQYINGINVTSEDNVTTTKKIKNLLTTNYYDYDSAGKVFVDALYNYSTGIFNDIAKLQNQVFLDKYPLGSEDRNNFFKKIIYTELQKTTFLRNNYYSNSMEYMPYPLNFSSSEVTNVKNKVTKTLNYIFNKNLKKHAEYNTNGPGNDLNYIKDIDSYNSQLANLIENAHADRVVTDEIKKRIEDQIIKNNKKLIFVTHSQGNEQLRTAINELWIDKSLDTNFMYKLKNYIGVVQVAAPSPKYIFPIEGENKRGAAFKVEDDAVIQFFSNHIFLRDSSTSVGPTHKIDFLKSKFFEFGDIVYTPPQKAALIAAGFVSSSLFHGMDQTYLNPYVLSYDLNNPSAQSRPNSEIFKDKVREVASALPSNCGTVLLSDELVENGEARSTFHLIKKSKTDFDFAINLGESDGNNIKLIDNSRAFYWVAKSSLGEIQQGTLPIQILNMKGEFFDLTIYDQITNIQTKSRIYVRDQDFSFYKDYINENVRLSEKSVITFRSDERLGERELFDGEWDFGDGEQENKLGNGFFNIHLYKNYGLYNVKLKLKNRLDNKTVNLAVNYSISPPFEYSILNSSYNIKTYLTELPETGTSTRARFHSMTATLKIKGPITSGIQLVSFPENSLNQSYISKIECGEWTKNELGCTRGENQPIETIIYAHQVTNCGGEGCPYTLGNIIGFDYMNPDSSEVNYIPLESSIDIFDF